jgi:hypothetical protein
MKIFRLVFTAAFFFFSAETAFAQQLERNDSERQLFELLNRERAENNLPALRWNDALFKAARKHALLMADLGELEHQLPNEPKLEERLAATGARFSVIAENIAFGQNPQTIHSGWMNSPGHRKNILNPRLTSVGIAAVHGTAGFFAVQDFSTVVGDLSLEQQEQKVVSLLTEAGLRNVSAASSARKSCGNDEHIADSSAKSLVHFEVPDLNPLPDEILRKLRGSPYSKATVGACRGNGAAGFTRYRIVILFY